MRHLPKVTQSIIPLETGFLHRFPRIETKVRINKPAKSRSTPPLSALLGLVARFCTKVGKALCNPRGLQAQPLGYTTPWDLLQINRGPQGAAGPTPGAGRMRVCVWTGRGSSLVAAAPADSHKGVSHHHLLHCLHLHPDRSISLASGCLSALSFSGTIHSSSLLFDNHWCLLSTRPWTGFLELRKMDKTPAKWVSEFS